MKSSGPIREMASTPTTDLRPRKTYRRHPQHLVQEDHFNPRSVEASTLLDFNRNLDLAYQLICFIYTLLVFGRVDKSKSTSTETLTKFVGRGHTDEENLASRKLDPQ